MFVLEGRKEKVPKGMVLSNQRKGSLYSVRKGQNKRWLVRDPLLHVGMATDKNRTLLDLNGPSFYSWTCEILMKKSCKKFYI